MIASIFFVAFGLFFLNALYVKAQLIFGANWAPIWVNTSIALLIFTYSASQTKIPFTSSYPIPTLVYFLGPLLCTAALLAALLSASFGSAEVKELDGRYIFFACLLVPFSEEIFFRYGISGMLIKLTGSGLGRYFSIVFFTAAHSLPFQSTEEFLSLGLPLGPLLLAMICEFLMWRFKALIIPILFHASANFTVVIFMLIDHRWLNWLSMLYI